MLTLLNAEKETRVPQANVFYRKESSCLFILRKKRECNTALLEKQLRAALIELPGQ